MSIKIYEAYRIPLEKLNEFLVYSREISYTRFKQQIIREMHFLDFEISKKEALEMCARTGIEISTRVVCVFALDKIINELKESGEKRSRFESSLNVWILDGYAYIIPYNVRYINLPEYAQDYHYQNQTDRPDCISEQEYKQRLKTWKSLCLDDFHKTRMNYKIVSFDKCYYDSMIRAEIFIKENAHLFKDKIKL